MSQCPLGPFCPLCAWYREARRLQERRLQERRVVLHRLDGTRHLLGVRSDGAFTDWPTT